MGVPMTALVFDRLTPEGRQVAIKAAKSYLGDKKETANYMGVFGIDLSLKAYVPFTRNAEELRKGIDSVENRASASFGVDKDRLARPGHGQTGAECGGLGRRRLVAQRRDPPVPPRSSRRWKRGC